MKENREITIYDVARVLNLSPSTVSRALKNKPHVSRETRNRITEAADKMGYRHNKFASNLRQKKTHTIGVVVPRLNSYFMAEALAGIEKIASDNGYSLLIAQSQESYIKEQLCISTLFNSRVDGFLVSLAYDSSDMEHFNILFKKNIPVVFFDRVKKCNNCVNVVIDNYRAGHEITTHLIEQSCKNIMHLGGNMLRNVYSERFCGYKQALLDKNLTFNNNFLVVSDMSSKAGSDFARRIIRMKHHPDAVFTSNDTTAVAIIAELENAGIRIPEDIAVAGFNNEPVGRFIKPNLTTVNYPAREMGETAVSMLLNRLTNSQAQHADTVVIDHKIIIRESSVRKTRGSQTTKTL